MGLSRVGVEFHGLLEAGNRLVELFHLGPGNAQMAE